MLEWIVGWMYVKFLNWVWLFWEFYVFEGMKDNEVGFYLKMYYVVIDGGVGVVLINMIYDILLIL